MSSKTEKGWLLCGLFISCLESLQRRSARVTIRETEINVLRLTKNPSSAHTEEKEEKKTAEQSNRGTKRWAVSGLFSEAERIITITFF